MLQDEGLTASSADSWAMPSTASAEPSAIASSSDVGIDSSGVSFDPSDEFDPFASPPGFPVVEFPSGRKGAGVGAVELSSDALPPSDELSAGVLSSIESFWAAIRPARAKT